LPKEVPDGDQFFEPAGFHSFLVEEMPEAGRTPPPQERAVHRLRQRFSISTSRWCGSRSDRSKGERSSASRLQSIVKTLATGLLGGNYVNRFHLEGRSYQVIPQVPRRQCPGLFRPKAPPVNITLSRRRRPAGAANRLGVDRTTGTDPNPP